MAAKVEKIYYSMGEVAEMLDVSATLLRFWEQKFDIIKPHKNKKGNRMFTPEDVRNLKTIYHLVKERGMTLAGAAKYLKASRSTIERDVEIAERLQSIRALLVEVRQELGGEGTVVDGDVDDEAHATIKHLTIKYAQVDDEVDNEVDNEARATKIETQAEERSKSTAYVEQTLF